MHVCSRSTRAVDDDDDEIESWRISPCISFASQQNVAILLAFN